MDGVSERDAALQHAVKVNEALDKARKTVRDNQDQQSGKMEEFLANYKTINSK